MSDRLIEKIEEIKHEYEPEAQAQFDIWIKKLRESDAIKLLRDHFAVQDFIKALKERIQSDNQILQEKRHMTLEERERIFIQKDVLNEFLSIFDVEMVEKQVEQIISEN